MSNLSEYVEKLNSADEAERIYAAEDIGYLADAVAPLVKRLGVEPSRMVRDAMFQSLMRIDSDAAIEGAVSLLTSDQPQIRNQAVEVLRHKGATSIPFLKVVMRDGDKDARKLVLDVLIGFQAPGVEEIYAVALSDADINVVITAVENVGKTRAAVFRPSIEKLLAATNSHPMLAGSCLEALGAIGSELSLAIIRSRFPDLAGLPDFFMVPVLKALGALGAEPEFVQVAGLLSVRAPLRNSILATLIAIHQRHPQETDADVLLPLIQKVTEDAGPSLGRYHAVRALGFLASRDDVYAFLITCLKNPERLVRLGAIESLRRTERPELQTILSEFAYEESDEEVLQALSA